MASILLALACLAIFLLTLIIIFALLPFSALSNKNGIPRDWPILGMFSSLVANFHNIMDWGPKVINHNKAPTFLLKGPWFSSVDLLITMDPANVQYTSSTRFANFRRGTKSRERFDVFGDGLFNSDDKEWMGHRKIHRSFFGNKQFNELSNGLAFDKAEKGVSVVLDHVASGGRLGGGGGVAGVVDLQDLFSRYTYDLTHRLMIGFDPQSLSLRWSQVPFAEAMSNAMQSVWMRHFLPESIWKLQRQVGVGHEKALKKAKDYLNKFSTTIVSEKHDEFNSQSSKIKQDEKLNDMLTAYLMEDERYHSGEKDEVLKASLLSLMLAGKDTTSAALTWVFWVLSQHPSIEAKIREEIVRVLPKEERQKSHVFTPEEISKLIYLHATVYETLRLYPPIPFQTRTPREPDILPSGHKVSPNSTMIVISLYFMARAEMVWGKDCADFKPERWITDGGGLKHEPSHKFFAFNSGPRICLGREVALTQIKAVAATILHNYEVQLVEKQKVVPIYSVVLQAKYGLQARVSKRWA